MIDQQPNSQSRVGYQGRQSLGFRGTMTNIIAAIVSLGVLTAAFIFAGIFIFGALLLGAALFVAFRIWRLFNKPDPEARQEFILRTVQKGMDRQQQRAAGGATPSAHGSTGATVIDGEAEEVSDVREPRS